MDILDKLENVVKNVDVMADCPRGKIIIENNDLWPRLCNVMMNCLDLDGVHYQMILPLFIQCTV